ACRPTGQLFQHANDPEGIAALVGRPGGLSPTPIVLEATGGYQLPLATAGLPAAVVNPRQARDFAKATGRLAKHDQIDAAGQGRQAGEGDPDGGGPHDQLAGHRRPQEPPTLGRQAGTTSPKPWFGP